MATLIAWTDYPILDLGDRPRQEAPVRRVEVLAWDRNKYVTVRLVDEPGTPIASFKQHYLYKTAGRFGTVTKIGTAQLYGVPATLEEEGTD